MIGFVITDDVGTILRLGAASTPEGAWQQRQDGERVATFPADTPLPQVYKLCVNFNTLLISRKDGVTEEVQGDGTAILELIDEASDVEE